MDGEQGINDSPAPSDIDEYNIEGYDNRTVSMSEWLDELYAFYMSIGVSFDEFWHGDYCRLKYRIDEYKARLKYDNRIAWLNGMYVYDAFGSVMASAFGKGGGKKYLGEPIELFPEDKNEAEKAADRRKEQLRAKNYFDNLIAAQKARKAAEKAKKK